MATESAERSAHNTLSGTTADAITITGFDTVDVINRSTSTALYFRSDGTTAVGAANGCDYVAPGGFVRHNADGRAISIVGDGNDYSVIGVSA